jgi:dihydrofolate reductase/thymidylate synthase
MYGYNLRHYGHPYENCKTDYTNKGIDQIKNIINLIKTDPYSRRIIMTTYNPANVDQGCLMPCHGIVIQFYVSNSTNSEVKNNSTNSERKNLSMCIYNRSQDVMLGVPFNIASYAILLQIISIECNMNPHDLIINMGDTHIYSNHIENAKIQLTQKTYSFPIIEINKFDSFENLSDSDFTLYGYLHDKSIKYDMVI